MKYNLFDVFEKKRLKWTYTIILVFFMVLIGVIYYDYEATTTNADIQEGISDSLIRFHVIANSDSKKDQELKLNVRDEIIDRMNDILETSESIEHTRKLISENINNIKGIAEQVVLDNGKNYKINVKLAMEEFPLKTYGDIVLPPGKYEALVVEIGEAKGKNWWCVMFPPLCFVDVTHGIVPDDSKEELKNMLTEEEYNAILLSDSKNDMPVKIRFKLFDWFTKGKDVEQSTVFVKLR